MVTSMFNIKKDSDDIKPELYESPAGTLVGSAVWYRRVFATSLGLNILLVLALLSFLSYGNMTYLFDKPEAKIIGITPDLQVIDIRPLNEPIMTPNSVTGWVVRTIMETMDIDSVHWKNDLTRVQGSYSKKAFADLVVSMERKTKILPFIRENKLIMMATPISSAIVTKQGDDGGVWYWKVNFDILQTFEGVKGMIPARKLEITVIVKRADTRKYPAGLKIVQVITKNKG